MNPVLARPARPTAPVLGEYKYFFIARYKTQFYLVEGDYQDILLRIQKDLYIKGGYVAKGIASTQFIGAFLDREWDRVNTTQFLKILYG